MRAATFREIAGTLVASGAVRPLVGLAEDEALVEQVLDVAYPEVHVQQRAAVRRDVRAVLAGLVEVLGRDWCHCGRLVVGATEEESPASSVLCVECAAVRGDAFPGTCKA